METIKLKAEEDIQCGTMVFFNNNLELKILKKSSETPIGIAARDISKGESVEYSSNFNTKDICIRGELI